MNYTVFSDQVLLDLFKNGDVSAFETLLNRYQTKLYNYIFLMVRQEALAEDIFQDTIVKVIKSVRDEKYYEDGKFISWVTRIAHNLIIDHFRKEKKMKMISTDNDEMSLLNFISLTDPSADEKMVNKQSLKEIRNLIDQLPHEQREVVIMRIYLNMSFKEIADQTGVSLNTALGRMRYALINIRKLMFDKKMRHTLAK